MNKFQGRFYLQTMMFSKKSWFELFKLWGSGKKETDFPELDWIYKADKCHNFLSVEHWKDLKI